MRRKCKHGIYTNATVKKCERKNCCREYCPMCKGPCRVEYIPDHAEYFGNHLSSPCLRFRRKSRSLHALHQHGFGKVQPGKIFIPYNSRYHYYLNEWKKIGRDDLTYFTNKEESKQYISDSIQYAIYSQEIYKLWKESSKYSRLDTI